MKKLITLILLLSLIISSLSIMPTYAATTKPYVQSDTNINFVLGHGKTYTYKMTVHGTHQVPKITTGNRSILQTVSTVHKVENGNDVYLFKVRAVGKSGQSAGVYTTLPGQSPVWHSSAAIPYTEGTYKVGVDIPAGDYAFTCAHPDISTGAIGSAISYGSETYSCNGLSSEGREYIRVMKGQTLELGNAYMIPLRDASKLYPVNGKYQPNTYRVGIDIPAGTYRLTKQYDLADSLYTIRSTINYSDDSNYILKEFYSETVVTVKDGQFLHVHEAYLEKA